MRQSAMYIIGELDKLGKKISCKYSDDLYKISRNLICIRTASNYDLITRLVPNLVVRCGMNGYAQMPLDVTSAFGSHKFRDPARPTSHTPSLILLSTWPF